LDSSLFYNQQSAWQAAGYCITSAGSVREGLARFHQGDFDMVLLGHSLPAESRERLAYLIRAAGSRTPVVSVSDSSGVSDPFADATIRVAHDKLLQAIQDFLDKRTAAYAAPEAN
jgi:DNA-binding response OmpR family regulator